MQNEYNQADIDELASLNEMCLEDRLYEIAIERIRNNEMDPVSEARAFKEAEGNMEKAWSFYIKYRVRCLCAQLIREIAAAQRHHDEEKHKRKKLEKEEIREREWFRNIYRSKYDFFMERLGRKMSRKVTTKIVVLAITVSVQFPNFSYANQWCDDLLDCENSTMNAVVMAETLRDHGYGVKWDTVNALDSINNRLTAARIVECNFSDERLEDESQRSQDRLVASFMNPNRTEVQILSLMISEANNCAQRF
jgi:hypothetical protein